MKRFLAFAYADYYPAGGASDLVGAFDDLEIAMQAAGDDYGATCGTAEVLDTQTGEVWNAYWVSRDKRLGAWAVSDNVAEKMGAACAQRAKRASDTPYNGQH